MKITVEEAGLAGKQIKITITYTSNDFEVATFTPAAADVVSTEAKAALIAKRISEQILLATATSSGGSSVTVTGLKGNPDIKTITINPGESGEKDVVSPVPEPTTLLLFGTTAAGIGLARWRRRKRQTVAGD